VTERGRNALRALVIAGGVAAVAASLLSFRASDWPIYLAYLIVGTILHLPYVEVLPSMPIPIPGLAATIGFLYIGGLPILVLQMVSGVLTHLLYPRFPASWRSVMHPTWPPGGMAGVRAGAPGEVLMGRADWATFLLGLAARWAIVTAIVHDGRPTAHPGAMAVAELGGYLAWMLVSALPIYSFRSPVWSMAERGVQPLIQDMFVIFVLGLTPFVFVIAAGYETYGLTGASLWALSTLGLHFMLKSLHERRVTVEEQNRQLETLNRELEHRERLSAIGKMSSVVSHQMLQQLGIIRLYADLVRHAEAGADPAAAVVQAKENAGRIEDALDGVNRVLTDLLVFSRDLRLHLYEHPLDRVLAECVEDCAPQAAERGVVLRLACEPDLLVTIDKLKVKQAVTNVVRNAIEASTAGAEVLIAGARRDGGVEIAVTDAGPGIAPADREAIFSPFFTRKENGTGLGLAIAREFVVAHGGRIDVEAAPSGGARFVVHLPAQPPAA
jgi:signal transduction histidine kinase